MATSLDLSRFENGIGEGRIVTIVGSPFASPVVRQSAFNVTPIIIGDSSGYDISGATGLRLYYDVDLGSATQLDLILEPLAAEPGDGGVPVQQGGDDIAFRPDSLVLIGTSGPLGRVPGQLRFTASRRGTLTFPRPSLLFRFAVESDDPSAGIALAVQSTLDGGGE